MTSKQAEEWGKILDNMVIKFRIHKLQILINNLKIIFLVFIQMKK